MSTRNGTPVAGSNDDEFVGIEDLIEANLVKVSAGFEKFSRHISTEDCPISELCV